MKPARLDSAPPYRGRNGVSLRLPTKMPPCFDSQAQWNEYRRLASASAGEGFTFCTDCNALYKREMQAQGRCRFPGTVFVTVMTVTVGRRKRTLQ